MKRTQLRLLENYSPYGPPPPPYAPQSRRPEKEDDVERVARSSLKGMGAGALLGGVGALTAMSRPSAKGEKYTNPFQSFDKGIGPFNKVLQRGRELGGVASKHGSKIGWGLAAGAAVGGLYKGAKKLHKIYNERGRNNPPPQQQGRPSYGQPSYGPPQQSMSAPYPYQPSPAYNSGGYPAY